MKAEPSRLIPRKLIEKLEILIVDSSQATIQNYNRSVSGKINMTPFESILFSKCDSTHLIIFKTTILLSPFHAIIGKRQGDHGPTSIFIL